MRKSGIRTIALALAGPAALAACTSVALAPAPPPARPTAAPAPAPEPSAESKALKIYYQRLQQDLVAQGLMRQDGGGPDTPFTQQNLVDNFIRIALYDEYTTRRGRLIERQTPSRLRRWEKPVRFGIYFGPNVPAAQRARDQATISGYTARLGRLTGHPVSLVSHNANFNVLVVDEDERRALAPKLRQLVPGIDAASIRTLTNLPRSILCLVLAFSEGTGFEYTNAVAIVRAEHPDLMRLSCVHEELAQGMGLANDSPLARPSVFNDDEEFGLLTSQDELMLKMLYDRRMRVGMTADAALPVARIIASELMGDGA